MAPSSKRKRKSTSTSTKAKNNKRQKRQEEFYLVKAILQEEYRKGKRHFLVDWEGVNPKTNKPYDPEWIVEEWATEYLVEEWDRLKAERAAGVDKAPTSSSQSSPLRQLPPPQPRQRARVVESSPSVHVSTRSPEPSTRPQSTLSQTSPEHIIPPKPLPHLSPRVQIDLRSSFDPAEFERISQLPNSGRPLNSSQTSSSYSGSRKYRQSGVCPDSESEDDDDEGVEDIEEEIDGSASYIPTTQVSGDSLQSSLPANQVTSLCGKPTSVSSTNRSLQISTYSTSPNRARTHSPAISIPETEPEPSYQIIADSQTQARQEEIFPGDQEIPDTFETIVSTSQSVPSEAEKDITEQIEVEKSVTDPIEVEQDITNRPDQALSTSESLDQEAQATSCADPDTGNASQSAAEADGEDHEGCQTAQQNIPPASSPDLGTLAEGATGGTSESRPNQQADVVIQGHNSQDRLSLVPEQPFVAEYGLEVSAQQHIHIEEDSSPVHSAVIERAEFATPTNNSSLNASLRTEDSIPWQHHPESAEQYAQRIPANNCSSTQNYGAEVIVRTVEKHDFSSQPPSPPPRHDSSQQSPALYDHPTASSSSVVQPPTASLDTADSNVPARPHSPTSLMMDSVADEIAKELSQPSATFTPTRRLIPSTLFDDDVTRSPSAIPADRPLGSQVPTSLRTVVMASNAPVATETPLVEPTPELILTSDSAINGLSDNNEAANLLNAVNAGSDEDPIDMNDNVSLLNDDLQLQLQEFLVPLPMEGRQANIYKDEFKNHRTIVESFLNEPEVFNDLDGIEKLLHRLRSIETHVDLLYSEPSSTQGGGSQTALSTQLEHQHQAQWSAENSIKFKFLTILLDNLRKTNLSIILVIEKNSKPLMTIIENFLRGISIAFKNATSDVQAVPAETTGNLAVTLLSADESPIVQPPDVIIVLDGCLEAKQIRAKNWAANPEKPTAPILHLAIPRVTDHIERYISGTLDLRRRLHTIIATLAQFQEEYVIGQPIFPHTSHVDEAAHSVANFLLSREYNQGTTIEWPLLSIGTIKEVIEYQSQVSQEAIASPRLQPLPAKRAIEDDQSDPAKRMRYTPQPHDTSAVEHMNEVTHISDSMPRTATNVSKLQEQLEDVSRQFNEERNLRRAQEKQAKQELAHWERQQTRHEEFSRTYNSLKKEKETAETRLEIAARTESNLREQLTTKKDEHAAMQIKLKEFQDIHLLSEDEKIVQITRLSRELEAARESEKRAVKSKASSEKDLEYIKDQYQKAQTSARDALQENAELKKQLEAARRQSSTEVFDLAQLHYERQDKLAKHREDANLLQIGFLKKQLASKEEENARLKASRGVGVGTRAQSVGARTRPSSRAASPLPGNRVTNLRNVG